MFIIPCFAFSPFISNSVSSSITAFTRTRESGDFRENAHLSCFKSYIVCNGKRICEQTVAYSKYIND